MLYNGQTRIKEEFDVQLSLWVSVYTCLETVQATVIMDVLELWLSSSEKPFRQTLGRIDAKLFSTLNLNPAKEAIYCLGSSILLKRY